jgi:hypothetical protein
MTLRDEWVGLLARIIVVIAIAVLAYELIRRLM